MQRLNGIGFYELGMKLYPIAQVNDETLYKDIFFELYTARTAIRVLLELIPAGSAVTLPNR